MASQTYYLFFTTVFTMIRALVHTDAFDGFEHKIIEKTSKRISSFAFFLKRLPYHLHTIHLFTHDQFFDVIGPCTIFALCAAFASTTLGLPTIGASTILLRTPAIVAWLWALVLQFCLHNQRHPDSIEEDALNKPWRPLPAGRISITATNYILLADYLVIAAVSCYNKTAPIWAAYTLLVILYNDLRGGDIHGLARNAINAGGYFCFFSSALEVAIGSHIALSSSSYRWIAFLCLALFTTFHSQDFRDEVGDAARGRKTILSAVGNTAARLILIAMVSLWSIAIPMWFGVGWTGMLVPGLLATAVAVMTAMGRGGGKVKLDSKMYKVWCLWMVSLTPTPLVAYLTQSASV